MISTDHEEVIKRRLVRLVHVLLTHSWNKSVSKEEFGRRCAWSVELIIDEIENPSTVGELGTQLAAERIWERVGRRIENDWEDTPYYDGSRKRA